jgi:spoIIIJ-associated protein
MEWVQTTGKTVEEALEAALDELGVHKEDVEYEVLEEPKTGLMARLRGGEARLRVRLKPISREKPQDKRRGKAKGGGRRNEGSRKGGGSRRDDSRRDDSRTKKSPQTQVETRTEEKPTVDHDEISVEDQAEVAEEFVAGLVEAMGLDADITSSTGDDLVEVQVEGAELGLLVGPKGATLTAIEELARAAVQKESGGHAARIRVDVGGYRAKRRAALEAFARKVADEVIDSGEARALEPMGSVDRKTVHDAVTEIEGVETSSEGDDPRRYVVIRPA